VESGTTLTIEAGVVVKFDYVATTTPDVGQNIDIIFACQFRITLSSPNAMYKKGYYHSVPLRPGKARKPL